MVIPFLLILPLFRLRIDIPGTQIESYELLLALVFFATLLRCFKEKQIYMVNYLFGFYIGLLMISSLVNQLNPIEEKGSFLHGVIFPFMIYFTLINVKELKWMKKIIFPCLAFSSILFLIFLIYYSSGMGTRLVAGSNNPLYLGQYFSYFQMLVVFFGLPLYFVANTYKKYILIGIIFAGFGLLISGTRTAMFATTIGIMIMFLFYKRLTKGLITFSLIIILSLLTPITAKAPIVGISINIFNIITRGTGEISRSYKQIRRRPYWNMAYFLIREKPFLGYGLQEYGKLVSDSYKWYQLFYITELGDRTLLSRWTPDVPHPHNLYLNIMVVGGIISLTSFLLFILGVVRRAVNASRKIGDLGLDIILLPPLTGILGFLIAGFFAIPFFSGGQYLFVFYFLVGLTERVSREANLKKRLKE